MTFVRKNIDQQSDSTSSDLEVGELRVLLLQDVGHVVDQMQTKSILGGDFLPKTKVQLMNEHTPKHTDTHLCIHLHSQWRV